MDVSSRARGSARILGAMLLCALLLRVGWGLTRGTSGPAIDGLPDQREYLALAQNLLHGDGLRFLDARFGDWVYAYRTPGYPLFLAAFRADLRWVRLVQALLDTSTVLAVYLLARRLLPRDALERGGALLAAALVAFNPFLIYFSGLILSETLFVAMLTWGMLLLLPERDDEAAASSRWQGTPTWLAGAVLLALAVLVRPSAVALPVLLGIGAAFVNRSPGRNGPNSGESGAYQTRRALRWRLPVGATMLLLTGLALLPWAFRNSRPNVLGHWIWTTTNGGITAYDGFNPDATGASDQSFVRSMPQLRDMGEIARSEYLEGKARQFIREHPARAAELAMAKFARTWSPVPLSDQFGGGIYRTAALLYSVPFDLLVLAGLIKGNLRRPAKVFLLLPAIYFTAVHVASVGSLRYRLPADPPMAVLAAAILAYPRADWKRVG